MKQARFLLTVVALLMALAPAAVLALDSGNYSGDDLYDPAATPPELGLVASVNNFSGDDSYDPATQSTSQHRTYDDVTSDAVQELASAEDLRWLDRPVDGDQGYDPVSSGGIALRSKPHYSLVPPATTDPGLIAMYELAWDENLRWLDRPVAGNLSDDDSYDPATGADSDAAPLDPEVDEFGIPNSQSAGDASHDPGVDEFGIPFTQ
ncbi:MAG: hypothetical protein U9R25_13625 [Chloroflexota bacterium]|nr:hypothetical protein [Chloroflexota bacterium]